ncbi:PilX N-terminal domain-containing pilus assembly protein [Dyella sp. EPa41]|uniref:pilus assembly PilX family protein n=1 Tax=Dyella sp. EPa41 TaxID=1561194 RepID=UPI0019163558|nr:PilX N-terminal domain-containing pilus assembly protein [Dyella sp. EPa41]
MSFRCIAARRMTAPRREQGVVLVVALVFLVLLTILGISAATHSLLQERMAGGLRNAQQAEMSAEAALRGAEWRLWKASSSVDANVRCGATVLTDCYLYDPAVPVAVVTQFRTRAGWLPSAGTEYNASNGGIDFTQSSAGLENAALAHNPRYLIEDLGEERPPGVGSQHESGVTSSANTGAGNPSTHIYRITARGVGGSENAVRVVESTFGAKGN